MSICLSIGLSSVYVSINACLSVYSCKMCLCVCVYCGVCVGAVASVCVCVYVCYCMQKKTSNIRHPMSLCYTVLLCQQCINP